jgi:CheY-like chemotaxis protein/anti-sigma regulatory factor (Ser/Thr protein kinase)
LLHQQYLKDQFVSTISHALRTPLNTIIGFCDLLRDDIQYKQDMLELQGMMSQSARHLLTVINDILDRSQLTSGQLKLKKEPFDLPQTIRNAFQMFNAARTNTQVDLQLDLQGLPQWVLGDAQRLTQIMVNLLNNAIKFTPQGFIRLTAYAVDHAIRFEVQDTGSGIPADRMNHIFDQYEQVDVATHRKKGHGLGLSITKHLIEAQKGWISVQSQVNRGTTFTFEIQFPATQAPMASPSITQTVQSTQQHLRILIVDDQPLNRLLARQVLQRQWRDIVLTEASDGVQAIHQLSSQPVDLILMDVLMPEMDGISATQHIRTQLPAALARTPILGLTANAYEITRRQCLEAGMNDIIYKPFNREQLIHAIQQLTWSTHALEPQKPTQSQRHPRSDPCRTTSSVSANSDIIVNATEHPTVGESNRFATGNF